MSLLEKDQRYILNVYNRIPLEIDYCKGSYIYDTNGNKYLDMFSGISVTNLGHSQQGIVDKIIEQSKKYTHLSNYFVSPPVINLAKTLVENTFASKVFFTNSGAESIEAAIKCARKFGKSYNNNKTKILSAINSFHGRTMGGLSITGQHKYQDAFSPLLSNVDHFKFNDIEDFENKIDNTVCAVFLEIIQGEGGIREVSSDFISKLQELSKRYNFLIVIDEIQTGIGRTGDFLASDKFELKPHMTTLAKSIGGGLPLGALLIDQSIENVLTTGDHGSTFGGNPVCCAAGEYLVNKVLEEDFKAEIKEKSDYIINEIKKIQNKFPNIIKDIRGRGLMIGIDVSDFSHQIKDLAFKKQLLLNVTNNTVIRLLPPLNISITDIDEFLNIFEDILLQINGKAIDSY